MISYRRGFVSYIRQATGRGPRSFTQDGKTKLFSRIIHSSLSTKTTHSPDSQTRPAHRTASRPTAHDHAHNRDCINNPTEYGGARSGDTGAEISNRQRFFESFPYRIGYFTGG